MASEVEVEASAPESMLSQKQDGTIGNMKEDDQGKNDLEASKGNNDNTNGECFSYPPIVDKVACEDKGRVSEDCPKAAEHDQVQTTILGSSNQHNEIEKSGTADGVQEQITRKSNLDIEGKEASKEELIQSEKKEHMEDEKEKIETATSLIVSDQVLISKTMKDEKKADIKAGTVSNSTFEENLWDETRDEEKNSQVNVVNKENTTEADGKEINGTLDSDLSQKENDSSLGNDSVGEEDEIHKPSSKIETIEDKEEKMVLMGERVHEEQASGVTESRELTPSEGNADEEATVKDIELPTEVEEKCAEPLKFAPEKRQEGNNSEESLETNMETKTSKSDLQKSEAASDDKELKDVPAEVNINQRTGAEPIQQSLLGSNAEVNESIHDDDKEPSTEENSESRDFLIEKEGNESTLSEEHTHEKNNMKDSAARESIGDAYETEFSNPQEETNQNMAEESANEEIAEDVKGETEQKASPEEDNFDTTRISEDNTIEAYVKGIAHILESDPSKEENDSSLGNDSMEKKDENQESVSKIETIEEHKEGRVLSLGERNQNEQAAEVSESRKITPAVADADEEAAVKDINLATELVEDKCAEPLDSEPEKRPEGNSSEELIETNLDMKASDNALHKSGEASDEKEEVNEDFPAEDNLTLQTGPETVQQSLPGSTPEVNESIDDDDKEHCAEKISDDFPIEKEGDECTFEDHTHEKNDVQDSAAKDLADASNEKELTDVKQVTVQNAAQDDTIEETAEGAKDETEELSPGKIEDLVRSTSPETTAPEQSAENVTIGETLGSIIQESEISPMESAAELTSSPVVEKIDDTPEEQKVEEKSSNRSTEIDEQVDQTHLSYDAQGNSSQNLDMCNEEENEALPTESSDMNNEAFKEEPNQNPIEISENETVNITQGAVDVSGEQSRDEQNLKEPASEETKAINEEKPDVTPNPTEEDSVAGLTDEGLTQNHQTIEEREENVKAKPAEPSNKDNACDSQSPEIAEEMATTASSVEYVAAEEIVQSHVELNTPCTNAEGNSPEITTTEVKRTPSDQEHEGVIPISHGPSTKQNPEPVDAVKEFDSESAAPCDNSLISANKSKEVEEQDTQTTEDMVSERNNEDQGLRVLEEDNELNSESSINEAEDVDHEATEVDGKEIQAVKHEATEEDVQHVEKGTVDEQEKSDIKHEDSSQQHDEKNTTESDIAEIQENKEEAHERSRPNEIHIADTVKDEEIVNCELEEINTSNSIGNEEPIEASQGSGENTSVSDDEVQLPAAQEETACDKHQDAEDDDSNNATDAISAEENPVRVDAVDKPELVTETATTDDDCIASDDANKSVAERSSSVVEGKNDNSDKHLLQEEQSNNQGSRITVIETELKDRELQLDEDTRSIRKEANDDDIREVAHDEEKVKAANLDTPQHYENSTADLDNIQVEKNGEAHEQSESEEIRGNDGVRHEASADQRFESISSNEVANQESVEASPSHEEHTNTSSPREGNKFIEVQDEAAIKKQHENLEDETPTIDGVSTEENPEPVDAVEKLDSMSAVACDDDLSSKTQETSHVKDQDAKSSEHQPTVAHNDNQALSVTTADVEVDDEWSKNNSEDADQEKIELPKVDPPQKLDESTTTESEHIDVRKDGELKTRGFPETCGTDTIKDEQIVHQDRNSDNAMGDEETVEASPSQDEKARITNNRIQDSEIQDKAKTDEQSEKIEDENSRDVAKDAPIEENPKRAEDVELLKCGTRPAAANDNSTTSDEANKPAEHEIQEEQNANHGLSVTEVGNQLEDEEPMGKGKDANQCASMVQEAKELELNEETQSIVKTATDENSPQVADTEEEFADANNNPEQNDKESTTEIDNNEVLKNVKTHEESGSEVIHGKETRDEELVDKSIEEINSGNQTANQESTEASPSQDDPSQDDCTMVSEDGNQVTEVQEETAIENPNETIEVEDIAKTIDNVSAEEVKSDTIHEDSSHQQDEKNTTESDIAEIQEDKEAAHERHRSIEIHVADIVKDEIANCELEDINTGNSIGNKEATEASQGNGENTSISDDEVQLPGVQKETTIHKLEDAENESNNITDAISAEEKPVPVDAVDKPELVTEPAATDEDCITSDEADKSVAEHSSSVVECENDNSDKHLLQEEHSNNQDLSVTGIETELKDRELQLDKDARSIRKEANDDDMQEVAHYEEKLEAANLDTPQHYKNSTAELDNIQVKKNGKAHEQSQSEEIRGNDGVRHEASVDQRFEETISSNEAANQENIKASPSHEEHTKTSCPREGNQVTEVQDEAIKEHHKNLEDETPTIDSVSGEENPEPVDAVEKPDSMSSAACDDDLSSETQETRHVRDQDAKSTEHQPTVGHNDNQALSVTAADNEVDDECSKNKSEDADQEKIEDPIVDPPQKLHESTTTESEHIGVRKHGEHKTSGSPETCRTDTIKDEEIMNQDRNCDNAMGDEETVEASPSQDKKASISNNRIQDIEIQDKAKPDEQSEKIEDGHSRDIAKDVLIEENPKPAEDVELLKCGTKSAAANDNSITSDEAGKSAEHEIQKEQNANQGLIVTGVGNQLEGDEPMGKGEDANQCASMVQELKELKHNEETQSIAKEAIDENSQQVADTEEEFADANNDSEQNDKESTTEIDNNEHLKNVKTHEESGSEVIHGKETRDEELVDKRIEEINSGNQTANQESTEASPSQDDCTMVSDDRNQVTEVHEETIMGKPNEKIEVEDITKMIDNVSAGENPEPPEAAEKLECCTNSDTATERTITSDEADKSATEESNKVVKYPCTPSAEQLLQEGHSENEDFLKKEGDANQDPEPVDAVEKLDSESVATCEDSQTYSEVNKSGTEETQDVEEKDAKLAEHLPAKGHNDNQGATVTKVDDELNDEGSIKNSECVDQEATEGKPVKRTQNMKQVATENDFHNETVGEIEDENDRAEEHEPDESNETHGADIVEDKEMVSQDSNCGNTIGNEEAIEAFPSQDGKGYTSNDGNQVIGVHQEAKMDEQQGKIEDENSSNIIGGIPVYESSKPAVMNEAIKSVEHAIEEEESDNQGLAVTGLDNELEDEESTSKREEANQAAKDLELTNETQSMTKEATDEDLRQVANDEVGILSNYNSKAADHQCAQPDELLVQEGYKEDESSVNKGADANQVARELDISTETESVRNEAAEEAFQQVTDDEEKVINGNVESPQQPGECNIAEIEKTKSQRDEDVHQQNEGSEIHGKDKVLDEEIMIRKSEESNHAEQSQEHVEAFTSNTNAESPIPMEDKCKIDNEGIQVTEVQKEATTQSQHHSAPNDRMQDKDPIKSIDNVSKEENLEQPECGTELKKPPEANTTEGETTSRDVNDLESSSTENVTGSGYIEAESLGIEGKGSGLAKAATEKEEEANKPAEDHQINKEPEGIDNSKSNKDENQQTITEEAKPTDCSGDLSQLEKERNTSASDDVQVHENGQTNEICKSGEMDGSDFDKEKEIINHGFEPDNSSNDVQDQQRSPGVEASEKTGDEKDALSLFECPVISSDQAQVAEAIETKARDRECQTHESEDPESTNMISAEEVEHVDTLISENKTEPVEDELKEDSNEEQDASVPAMTLEETIKEEEKQGADSVEVKLNITNMSKAEETGSLEEHSEGSIMKTLGVSSAEETPEVDENNTKGIASEIEPPENPAAGETNREHESGDMALTEENANQSAGNQELDDTQQGSKIASSINCEAAQAIITEEDQLNQPSSEQHEMENEDTIATEDQEESLTDVQILKEEKSEDKFLENATQEADPKVPTSDFEPAEGSQLKQELVEEAGKRDESSIAEHSDFPSGSEFQGANAPSESVTERDIDSCSQRIINENEVQLTNKLEQVANVFLPNDSPSEDQEQPESSEQVLKLHGQGITKPEETGKEEHHNAIIRELIPEENQGEKDFEANDATISNTKREENLGLVDPIKNPEGSSDLVVASEKITKGEADLAENEENIVEMAGHKAYSVGNQHGRETSLSMHQKETNSDECSMDKTEEVDQVIEGPRISDKSDECERQTIKEDLQQATTGEQAENEEKYMITEAHIPKQAEERNTSELENIEVQKDVIGQGPGEDSSSIKDKNQQSSSGDELPGLQKGAEDNTQNHEYVEISSNTTAVETQHPAPPDNVSTEQVKYMYEPIPTGKAETATTEAHDSNALDAKDMQAEQAPMEESAKTENILTQQPDFPEENPKEEDKRAVVCQDNMSNTENITLVKEEPSSEETLRQGNVEKDLDIGSSAKTEQPDDREKFSLEVEELAAKEAKETISITQLEHKSRDVALAEDNANQLAEMLHVDNTEGAVVIPNDMESRTNCQDVEEVTAVDIIARQISQVIEEEEQRQQQSAEQLKNDNTFDNEVLKEEDTSHTCLEETTKQTSLPDERERERKLEPQKDWQPKQETEKQIEKIDDVKMAETEDFPAAFQGADCPLKIKTNKVSETSTEILNNKEIKYSNKLVSHQVDTVSQLISEESHANSCTATTDNNKQMASLEKVPEIHDEGQSKSEEIDPEKHHKTISSRLLADEKSVLTSKADQTTKSDATEETADPKGIYGEGQHPADEETITRSQKADDKQTMIEKTKILDEKVQVSQQTTKSDDKAEEYTREDEDTLSLSGGQKEAAFRGKVSSLDIRNTQASILVPRTPEATEERKAKIVTDDTDSPTEPKHPENVITVTDGQILEKCAINTHKQPCQLSKENQQPTPEVIQEDRVRVQDRNDKESLEIQPMESTAKLENTNVSCTLVGETMDTSLNKMHPQDTTKEASEEVNQIGSCPSQVMSTAEFHGNKVVTLQQQDPLKGLQIEEADESSTRVHMAESKARSMPLDSGRITAQTCQKGCHMTDKGGQTIPKEETPDGKEATAEEEKTDEEKDESIDQGYEDLQREIPITAEALREMELKATQKKSHNLLSGVGSKVKHSISKMKKAIACSSAQFSQEDVIIKVNKNKKA